MEKEKHILKLTDKEYSLIHAFIRRNIVKKKCCENCGLEKKLDNALIHGKQHERNIENYMQLCRACHIKYDFPNGKTHTEESKLKIGIASSQRIKERGVHPNFINAHKGAIESEATRKLKSEIQKELWKTRKRKSS